MAKKNEIQIIITAVDKASGVLKKTGLSLEGLGQAGLIAGGAIAAVAAGVGLVALNLAKDAAKVDRTRKTWDNLAKSYGEAGGNIESLREATRGMVNDADLMYSSSKLMSMGLAKSNDEAAHLLEISTQLGSAMGVDATTAAEDFALMLANQSIPRLDTFGISSGVVRQRIEEMMAADVNLTREQAFLNAVLEEAEKTLAKVGEQGTGAAADMARLEANVDNLKSGIGQALLPVLATVSEKLVELWDKPETKAAIDKLIGWIKTVVGDEKSGIVGVMTALTNNDIHGALEAAFGDDTAIKIENTATAIGKVYDWLSDPDNSAMKAGENVTKFRDVTLIAFDDVIITVADLERGMKTVGTALQILWEQIANAINNLSVSIGIKVYDITVKVRNLISAINTLTGLKIPLPNLPDVPGGNIPFPKASGTPLTNNYGLGGATGSAAASAIGGSNVNNLYQGIASGVNNLSGLRRAGFASGGSFIVPGSGSGDRPFGIGLTPGERVTVTPKGQSAGMGLSLTVNINSAVNLADRAYAERELMPYIEAGVRQLLARSA
ncbi:MAG: hypothetical protein ACYC4Q_08030 [Victivallaceae bacterium]